MNYLLFISIEANKLGMHRKFSLKRLKTNGSKMDQSVYKVYSMDPSPEYGKRQNEPKMFE